jgi:PAS domain S-box-containing protein
MIEYKGQGRQVSAVLDVFMTEQLFPLSTVAPPDVVETSPTELSQLHQILHQRAQQLSLLNDMAREMTGLTTTRAIYDLVTQQLWLRFGYYSVEIFSVDAEQEWVILESCAGAYIHLMEIGKYRQKRGQGIIGTAVQTGQMIVANQAQQHPAFYYLPGAEVQAELAIPLKNGDRVVGLLNVDSEQPGTFTEADVTLMMTLCDQMVIALEKVRLFEETQQRADEMARLFDVAQDLATTLDTTELLQKIVRHLTEAIQATSGYIISLNDDGETVTLVAEYLGREASALEMVSDVGRTYRLVDYPKMTRAIQQQRVVMTDADDPDLAAMERQQLLDYGVQSVLIVPFVARGRVLGEAEIWESRHSRLFTPREINLVQTIAQHAASVIDNAHLFERIQYQAHHLEEQVAARTIELVQTNEQLRQEIAERQRAEAAVQKSQAELKAQTEALALVNAISDTLYRTLNYEAVVERAVNALVTYARFEAVGIFALNQNKGVLELLASRNFSPAMIKVGAKMPLQGSLGGEAVRRREMITSVDLWQDERVSDSIREAVSQHDLRAAICLPILYQTEVLGTVHLLSATLPPLTPLNNKTLMAIGRTIGLAMSNARYVNQVEAQVKERARVEAAWQESEARFRRLAENAPDIVFRFRFDPPGYEYINPALERITGYNVDLFYKDYRAVLKVIHPDDHALLLAFIHKQIEPEIQVRLVHANGSIRWLEQRHVVIYDEAGNIVAVEGIGRDITALKEALAALQGSREL